MDPLWLDTEEPAAVPHPPTPPKGGGSRSPRGGTTVDVENSGERRAAPEAFVRRMEQKSADKKSKESSSDTQESKTLDSQNIRSGGLRSPRKAPSRDPDTATSAPPSPQTVSLLFNGGIVEGEEVDLSAVPELSETDVAAYQNVIAVVGSDAVARLKSTKYQHRLQGIKDAVEQIPLKAARARDGDAPRILSAFVEILAWGTADTVFHVSVASCQAIVELSHTPLLAFGDCSKLCVPLLAAASAKLKDSNAKVRDAAIESIIALAAHPHVGPLAAVVEVSNIGALTQDSSSWNSVLGRLEMISSLLIKYPDVTEVSAEKVMPFCAMALNSTNAKVRRKAVATVPMIHKIIGAAALEYLRDVPSATMRLVLSELEGVDGSEVGSAQRLEDEDVAAFENEKRLSENDAATVAMWDAAVTSIRSLRCIFSAKWKLREHVLDRILSRIGDPGDAVGGTSRAVSRTTSTAKESLTPRSKSTAATKDIIGSEAAVQCIAQVLQMGLSDAVPAVLGTALRATRAAVKAVPIGLLPIVSRSVLPILVTLLPNSSTNEAVMEVLLSLSAASTVGVTAVFDALLRWDTDLHKTNPKVVAARLDATNAVVLAQPPWDDPAAVNKVVPFFVTLFCYSQEKTRATAIASLVETYRRIGDRVRPFLVDLKAAQQDELKTHFLKVRKPAGGGGPASPHSPRLGIVVPVEEDPHEGTTLKERMAQQKDPRRNDQNDSISHADFSSPTGKGTIMLGGRGASSPRGESLSPRAPTESPRKRVDAVLKQANVNDDD